MARVTYQDDSITEYDDGTEEVRFTDAEWEAMLADSRFGYVCRLGHRQGDADHRYGACLTCEHMAEYEYDPDDEARYADQVDTDPAPAVSVAWGQELLAAMRAGVDVEPF